MKVRITYNTGFILEVEMSEYTFDYYTNQRQPLYVPKYPSIDFKENNNEFVSLYGAVKLEKVVEE